MKSTDQNIKPNPRGGWQLSEQHQLGLALLASLALIAIGLWYGWSVWRGEGDIDQATRIPLEFQVNVNQAEAGELMAIPSVGPKMAEAIVGHRDLQGPFETLGQLEDVPGIGPKKLEQLKKYMLPIR